MSRIQFIEQLRSRGLVFGWYNGEFVVVPEFAD
jgi:hypothetical protein